MAGIQHRGCTSSRSMNVSQDGPQFNACDEQGYISSHSIYLHRERTGQKGGGGDGFHLIYQVLPNYTICAQANTNKKHLRAHVVDNHSHVPTIQISICRPHASIYTHTHTTPHTLIHTQVSLRLCRICGVKSRGFIIFPHSSELSSSSLSRSDFNGSEIDSKSGFDSARHQDSCRFIIFPIGLFFDHYLHRAVHYLSLLMARLRHWLQVPPS